MMRLYRFSATTVRVSAGDWVCEGDPLGINPRTLECVLSPTDGVIRDIIHLRNSHCLIAVETPTFSAEQRRG